MDARVQVYSDKMQKAFEFLEADFAAIRAGRHFSGYKKAGTALCSARPHILTCFLYFLFVKFFMRQ